MSIRIRRVLGYGMTGLKHKNRELVDERLNLDSPFLNGEVYETTLSAYREFLQDRPNTAMERNLLSEKWLAKKDRKPMVDDAVHVSCSDYGLPGSLCLVPLWLVDSWVSRDHSVDYYLDSYVLGMNGESWAEKLVGGLHPYDGTYMDDRTGERVPSEILNWVRIMSRTDPNRWRVPVKYKKTEGWRVLLDEFAQIGGFENHDAARRHCRPYVPDEIRDLAEFGKLFVNPDTVLQLRPMIYTYWA